MIIDHRVTIGLSVAILVTVTCRPLRAQSLTWDGDTDTQWSDPTNWDSQSSPGTDPTTAPQGLQAAWFENAGNGNTTIDLGGGVSINTIIFDNSAAAYTIGAGGIGNQTLTMESGTIGSRIDVRSAVSNDQRFDSDLVLANTTPSGTEIRSESSRSIIFNGNVRGGGSGDHEMLINSTGQVVFNGVIGDGLSSTLSLRLQTTSSGLVLNGNNTFSGGVGGTEIGTMVSVGHHNSLGTGTAKMEGMRIMAHVPGLTLPNEVTVGPSVGGFRVGGDFDFTFSGEISLESDNRDFHNAGSATVTLSGDSVAANGSAISGAAFRPRFVGGRWNVPGTISGSNGVVIGGTTTEVSLSGNNTFSGDVILGGGQLSVGNAAALGLASNELIFNDTANAKSVRVDNDVMSVTLANDFAILEDDGGLEQATFHIAANKSLVLSGTLYSESIATQTFTKVGRGTLVMGGNDSASKNLLGNNIVGDGILRIDADLSNMLGSFDVAAGATLAGSGIIGGDTVIHGVHSPGASPGLQTFIGDLDYGPDASVLWELTDNGLSGRGSLYDGIDVGEALTFSGNAALVLDFGNSDSVVNWNDEFWDSDYLGASGWLLFDVEGSTTGLADFSLAAENWSDGVGNLFASVRNGASFSLFQDGNDIYLTYTSATAIPEPSSLATLATIWGLLVVRRRRR